MAHLHFIVNPAAGGNSCLEQFRELEKSIKNISYTVDYSEYPGHTTELAIKRAESGGCIVAVGGDGTVREVAIALVNTESFSSMGIIPLGTGNDLIKALSIPSNPADALELIIKKTPSKVDTMVVNDILCLNVAGLGFDVEVLRQTSYFKKKFNGQFPYLLGLLRAIFHLKFHRVRIQTDKNSWEEDVLLVAVGNGTHIGGGIKITPRAKTTDGLLDICIVSRVNLLKALLHIPKFVSGNHIGASFVRYENAKWVEVDCKSKLPVQLDGEIISSTPVSFRIQPASLKMIVGNNCIISRNKNADNLL